jgi:hypothetical protein
MTVSRRVLIQDLLGHVFFPHTSVTCASSRIPSAKSDGVPARDRSIISDLGQPSQNPKVIGLDVTTDELRAIRLEAKYELLVNLRVDMKHVFDNATTLEEVNEKVFEALSQQESRIKNALDGIARKTQASRKRADARLLESTKLRRTG